MSQSSIWIYCVLYFLKARDVASIYLKKKIDKFDKIQELPNNGGLTAPPPPSQTLAVFLHTLHLLVGYTPDHHWLNVMTM